MSLGTVVSFSACQGAEYRVGVGYPALCWSSRLGRRRREPTSRDCTVPRIRPMLHQRHDLLLGEPASAGLLVAMPVRQACPVGGVTRRTHRASHGPSGMRATWALIVIRWGSKVSYRAASLQAECTWIVRPIEEIDRGALHRARSRRPTRELLGRKRWDFERSG